MDEGFQLELKDGNQKAVTDWVEGPVEKAWYGLKIRGKRRLPVETWRCGRSPTLKAMRPRPGR